jgi:uncharacterized RDD family membrane protein YckC
VSYPPGPANPNDQQPQQPPQKGYAYLQQPGYNPNAEYGQTVGGMPELAGWGSRVGSFIIDWLIIFGGYMVCTIVANTGSNLSFLIPVGFLTLIAGGLYVCVQEGKTGQSPGKKAVGTRLLRAADGSVPGFGLALGRRLLHIVDGIPCYLGYLWPLWDPKKQTFADKIVGTVVVKSS